MGNEPREENDVNTSEILAILALLVSVLLLLRVVTLQAKVNELRDDLDRISRKVNFPTASGYKAAAPSPSPSPVSSDLPTDQQLYVDERVRQLLNQGKKIQAIKEVRDQLKLSLKDGKDYVEAIERQNG